MSVMESTRGYASDLRAAARAFNKAAKELQARGVEVEAHVRTFDIAANRTQQAELIVDSVKLKL